jgi:hypothetical protein
MTCPKCGNEFSLKVYRIHAAECHGLDAENGAPESGGEYTKDQLLDMADLYGVEVDRRWGIKRIREVLGV